MRRTLPVGCILMVATLARIAPAQAPETPPAQQIAALVKEVQTQQAAIGEKQDNIDTRIAALAEALRVARIYSSRGGR